MLKLGPDFLIISSCVLVILFTLHCSICVLYCANESSKSFICKSIKLNVNFQSLFLLTCLPTIGVYAYRIVKYGKQTPFVVVALYLLLLNAIWSIAFAIGIIHLGNNIFHIYVFIYISISMYLVFSFYTVVLWSNLRRKIVEKQKMVNDLELNRSEIYTIALCDV